MTSSPAVSVVIAAHNAERFLPDALATLGAQTYRDFEVVLVDDGSTDATPEIARAAGSRVRVLRQPRRGPAAARNLGIESARGRLICFLDSDDRWPETRLQAQAAVHLADDGLDYTVGRYRAFLEGETARPAWLRPRALGEGEVGFFAGTLMVRHAAFARVGPFDASRAVGETADWLIRAREVGLRFAVLPDLLLHRRVHGDNLTYRGAEINESILLSLKASLDRRRAGSGRSR